MAAHLESVRRALAQQDAEVDRFKAIIEENSALNERILEHEDTIARQAAALSTLRSENLKTHSKTLTTTNSRSTAIKQKSAMTPSPSFKQQRVVAFGICVPLLFC